SRRPGARVPEGREGTVDLGEEWTRPVRTPCFGVAAKRSFPDPSGPVAGTFIVGSPLSPRNSADPDAPSYRADFMQPSQSPPLDSCRLTLSLAQRAPFIVLGTHADGGMARRGAAVTAAPTGPL